MFVKSRGQNNKILLLDLTSNNKHLFQCTCEVDVQVIDNTPPTPICDEFTVVSLTSAGLTYTSAISFDDGSYDNCDHLAITFGAKRMGDPASGCTCSWTRADCTVHAQTA